MGHPRIRSVVRTLPFLAPLVVLTLACGGGSEPTGPPAGECVTGTTSQYTSLGGTGHVLDGTSVAYSSNPPSIGPHYGTPLANGTYATEQDARSWVHNLEHGAVVFLYDCPGACTEIETGLRSFAESRPADGGGAFRYVVSPRSNMPSAVAVVAWGWVYRAECVRTAEIEAFVDAHYRQAPEDIPTP